MTREEAINLLVNATYSDEWQGNEDLATANLMAIRSLEAWDKLYNKTVEYEQQAIEELKKCDRGSYGFIALNTALTERVAFKHDILDMMKEVEE